MLLVSSETLYSKARSVRVENPRFWIVARLLHLLVEGGHQKCCTRTSCQPPPRHPLCSLLLLSRTRCAPKVRGCHLSTACGPQPSTSETSTSTPPSPSWADCWSSIFKRRRWCRWVERGIRRVAPRWACSRKPSEKSHQWFIPELLTGSTKRLWKTVHIDELSSNVKGE